MSEELIAGVDGCPAGWVAVVGTRSAKDTLWLAVEPSFAELVSRFPRVKHWAVDMPIGLADAGPREADRLARNRLKPHRTASVFSAPPRCVAEYVAAEAGRADYREACRLASSATGKKISKQAWHITAKIAEVRTFLATSRRFVAGRPSGDRVFESHPELCFTRLNDGEPLIDGKKTARGVQVRRQLLNRVFGPVCVERLVVQAESTRGLNVDDAIDAMACFTAAARVASASGESVPAKPSRDADGLLMAITW